MIDLTDGSAITLREAARLPELRRNGRSPHVSTVFRWSQRGVRGVKLEVRANGGSIVTTPAAVRAFLDKLSGITSASPKPADNPRLRRASAILTGAGI